jgi:hypothetical protein
VNVKDDVGKAEEEQGYEVRVPNRKHPKQVLGTATRQRTWERNERGW